MTDAGYLYFSQPTLKSSVGGSLVLNLRGKVTGITPNQLSFPGLAGGKIIQLLVGGAVHQRRASEATAPLSLKPLNVQFDYVASDEEDYHMARSMAAVSNAEAVWVFLERPIEDVWLIPSTAQLVWTLSRWTAYNARTYAQLGDKCFYRDNADWSSDVILALGGSTPGAGEYWVDTTSVASTSIKTADISAHAGKYLFYRYHPWYQYVVANFEENVEFENGLGISFELSEMVPHRTYSTA